MEHLSLETTRSVSSILVKDKGEEEEVEVIEDSQDLEVLDMEGETRTDLKEDSGLGEEVTEIEVREEEVDPSTEEVIVDSIEDLDLGRDLPILRGLEEDPEVVFERLEDMEQVPPVEVDLHPSDLDLLLAGKDTLH
jgi:hypothetical protein